MELGQGGRGNWGRFGIGQGMKIAGYDAVTEIHLTEAEFTILGSQRIDLEFFPDARTGWVKITANRNGSHFIHQRDKQQQSHEYPYRTSIGRGIKHFGRFGLQPVNTKSPGPGVLLGDRPNFELAARTNNRTRDYSRGKKPQPLPDLTMDNIRDAVKLINNFLASHDGVEVTVEEGKLKIRMILEF